MSNGLQKAWPALLSSQTEGSVVPRVDKGFFVERVISQVKVESELREVWLHAVKCSASLQADMPTAFSAHCMRVQSA